MPLCAAYNCEERGVHRFPKNLALRKLWENALKRKAFKATDSSRLCRNHFKTDDYIGESAFTGMMPQHKFLKKNVVPSIFVWTKAETRVGLQREVWHVDRRKKKILQLQQTAEYSVFDKVSLQRTTPPSLKEEPWKITEKDSRFTLGECHRTYSNYAKQRVKKLTELNATHEYFPVKVKLEINYDNIEQLENYVDNKHYGIEEGESHCPCNAKRRELNQTVIGADLYSKVKSEVNIEENCYPHEIYCDSEDIPEINIKGKLGADIDAEIKSEMDIEENWYPQEKYFENEYISKVNVKKEECVINL